MRKLNSGAFTLIELLIVVLIIAILAAIAVPNFLEFQTRAKVSRVKNDMRSLATAIEAYNVDNGVPPVGISEGESINWWTRNAVTTDMNPLYKFFTTPIAYITTIPTDPFTENTGAISLPNTIRASDYFWYDSTKYGNLTGRVGDCYRNGFTWILRSYGPTRKGSSPWPLDMMRDLDHPRAAENIYDPTNGTISPGFILRTNKGIYTGP